MCAKPILDIAAGRPRDSSIRDCVAALEKAGYEHRGERGVPGRLLFGETYLARITCIWLKRPVLCGATI